MYTDINRPGCSIQAGEITQKYVFLGSYFYSIICIKYE